MAVPGGVIAPLWGGGAGAGIQVGGGASSGGSATRRRSTAISAAEIAPIAVTGVVGYVFGYQDLTASLTAAKLYRAIPGAAATFAQQGVSMINRGSIVAIAVRATEAITAQSATFVPYVEQAASPISAVWAAANRKVERFAPGLATFNADEELDVRVSTPVGFTPVTTDVEVIVYVTFDAS